MSHGTLRELPPEISSQFEKQVDVCVRMGSPLTAAICELVTKHGLPEGAVFDRIANWTNTGTLHGDVVQLRLTGALHRIVLDHPSGDLAAQYPPNPLDRVSLHEAVYKTVLQHSDFIEKYLDSPPQTNEVGRSAILLPALLQLAKRHQLPFNMFELGASAGLNQGLPHFAYDYGNWRWGETNSPVQLACEWRGAPPPQTSGEIIISSVMGCDIAPVAIETEAQRQRLTSYVWPDQPERLSRLRGALSIASNNPPIVEKSGAADWLSQVLDRPEKGQHALIMHTIMWQYMPAEEQQRCEDIIREFGSHASADAPVSWLRFEADGKSPGGLLSLTHWCGNDDDGSTQDLARADYHGKWIDWI